MQSYKILLTANEREKQKRPCGLCNGNLILDDNKLIDYKVAVLDRQQINKTFASFSNFV